MSWEMDVPRFPFQKPVLLEKLEQLGPDAREAMDGQEVKERIEEIANGLASSYHVAIEGDYESCCEIVSAALTETGAALGGKFGAVMVGTSDHSARSACRIVFPENDED